VAGARVGVGGADELEEVEHHQRGERGGVGGADGVNAAAHGLARPTARRGLFDVQWETGELGARGFEPIGVHFAGVDARPGGNHRAVERGRAEDDRGQARDDLGAVALEADVEHGVADRECAESLLERGRGLAGGGGAGDDVGAGPEPAAERETDARPRRGHGLLFAGEAAAEEGESGVERVVYAGRAAGKFFLRLDLARGWPVLAHHALGNGDEVVEHRERRGRVWRVEAVGWRVGVGRRWRLFWRERNVPERPRGDALEVARGARRLGLAVRLELGH